MQNQSSLVGSFSYKPTERKFTYSRKDIIALIEFNGYPLIAAECGAGLNPDLALRALNYHMAPSAIGDENILLQNAEGLKIADKCRAEYSRLGWGDSGLPEAEKKRLELYPYDAYSLTGE